MLVVKWLWGYRAGGEQSVCLPHFCKQMAFHMSAWHIFSSGLWKLAPLETFPRKVARLFQKSKKLLEDGLETKQLCRRDRNHTAGTYQTFFLESICLFFDSSGLPAIAQRAFQLWFTLKWTAVKNCLGLQTSLMADVRRADKWEMQGYTLSRECLKICHCSWKSSNFFQSLRIQRESLELEKR